MSAGAVRVKGLRELNRAFARANRDLKRELTGELKEAAEPVRATAERLAVSEITRMQHSRQWAEMRVGVTTRVVYVAPRQRGTRSPLRRRPNLAGLLLGRAMEPALERNRERVVRRVEALLQRIGNRWARS